MVTAIQGELFLTMLHDEVQPNIRKLWDGSGGKDGTITAGQSGDLTLRAYKEDSEFADPAASFRGLQRFKHNCTNFGSLLEKLNMNLTKWEDLEMTRATSVSAAICLDLHSAQAPMIFHRLNENLSIPVDAFNSCSLCTVLSRATLSSVDAFNSCSLCTVLSRTFVEIQKYLVIWHLLY
ncbi:uncharacterized protein [Miscanthus floridulus]|uniref:uncharacterized protein isoform X2 n=1 Tax=Miscanthus floridulus TaxID=154761 RepID=UPI0034579738